MDEVAVHVETEVNLTEAEEKVRTAVANIFGSITIEIKSSTQGSILVAETTGIDALAKLRNLLRTDRVRDAARRVFFRSLRGGAVSFCLNKQVAFAGHISFSEEVAESPLGPLKVKIESQSPRQLIDWLAPRTT